MEDQRKYHVGTFILQSGLQGDPGFGDYKSLKAKELTLEDYLEFELDAGYELHSIQITGTQNWGIVATAVTQRSTEGE